ncbi:MAG: glutamine amidotransferase [Planctomycetia bacterium]|jgi:uncharacterized membrane protein
MTKQVCYLGDDFLDGAAIYLAGIMSHFGISYDYVPSAESPPGDFLAQDYGLYVLSDYPAARWPTGMLTHLAEAVRNGASLAMFGGWESYYGLLGEYHDTALADILPVVMAKEDDRRNFAQPCLVRCNDPNHPITAGLPWHSPPCIGGLNVFRPKTNATQLLSAVRCSVTLGEEGYVMKSEEVFPLLVVGNCMNGRTIALATDVAPHWVGGFVDWGNDRVIEEVGDGFIDVGNWYATFFVNLLRWGLWDT